MGQMRSVGPFAHTPLRREYNFTALTSPPTQHTMLKTTPCNFFYFSTLPIIFRWGEENSKAFSKRMATVFGISVVKLMGNWLYYISIPRTFA